MKKKAAFLIFALIGIMLTGCPKKEAQSGEPAKLNEGETVTITIEYPYAHLFTDVHKELIEKFKKVHPEIEIVLRSTYESYEDATEKVLRASMTDNLPDITFQGLNRFRVLVDKDIAVPLNQFIDQEENFGEEGFNESMFAAGKFGNEVYGLPFAVSLPIAYYNMDLVRAAGWDENDLPDTWEEVIELSQRIGALPGDAYGMYFTWPITGNWFWQALVFSRGGSMMNPDETKVAFDGPEGEWAMDIFYRMISEGHQPDLSEDDARTAFAAGMMGMWFTSTSTLYKLTGMIGDKFELKTAEFPSVVPGKGTLPPGGNGAVIVTKDPVKQAAAWEVLKFWCGVEGGEVVARKTGYMPPNRVAAETRLQQFYQEHPNNLAAVNQLPLMSKWYAFPGENGLKITDVIYGKMELIATGKSTDPEQILEDMAGEVQTLIP